MVSAEGQREYLATFPSDLSLSANQRALSRFTHASAAEQGKQGPVPADPRSPLHHVSRMEV